MKHTYLYPLPASARFLWRMARADVSDLFGYPADHHKAGWVASVRLLDEFGRARDVVHRLIGNAPHVCIGEGYVIPGSLTEGGGKHHAVQPSTIRLTHLFWDAPELSLPLVKEVMSEFRAPVPGRDPRLEAGEFLRAHMGQHVIPVWM
jgi:hypothetical protein